MMDISGYRFPSEYSHLWALEPGVIYLNHGSFGACTKFILEKQQEYRSMLEGQPMSFMVRQLEGMINAARDKVSAFVNSDPADLVFVQNATAGVNTVFKSLHFSSGDVHIRMTVKYQDYKKYEGRSSIKYGDVVDDSAAPPATKKK